VHHFHLSRTSAQRVPKNIFPWSWSLRLNRLFELLIEFSSNRGQLRSKTCSTISLQVPRRKSIVSAGKYITIYSAVTLICKKQTVLNACHIDIAMWRN
jgi:hypothetical protein